MAAGSTSSSSNGDADVKRDATLVYNYHRMNMSIEPADAIFCLCSLDTRVARRAAQLFLDGFGARLIYSGGSGKLTAGRFGASSEADVFAAIARDMGVPAERIVVEPRSTNTGENVRFTRALLEERGLRPQSFILVQKPYMERRTWATFLKQWPEPQPRFAVTSSPLEFHEYPDAENPWDLVVNVMVGDLVRIREYPGKGYQVPQEIPDEVWEAGQRLIAAGFDSHLP